MASGFEELIVDILGPGALEQATKVVETIDLATEKLLKYNEIAKTLGSDGPGAQSLQQVISAQSQLNVLEKEYAGTLGTVKTGLALVNETMAQHNGSSKEVLTNLLLLTKAQREQAKAETEYSKANTESSKQRLIDSRAETIERQKALAAANETQKQKAAAAKEEAEFQKMLKQEAADRLAADEKQLAIEIQKEEHIRKQIAMWNQLLAAESAAQSRGGTTVESRNPSQFPRAPLTGSTGVTPAAATQDRYAVAGVTDAERAALQAKAAALDNVASSSKQAALAERELIEYTKEDIAALEAQGIVLKEGTYRLKESEAATAASATAVKNVGEETEKTTQKSSKLENMLQRMGLRFVLNLAIFQVVIEVFQRIKEKIDEMSSAITEAERRTQKAYDNLSKIREDQQKAKQTIAGQNFAHDPNEDDDIKKLKIQLDILKSQQEVGRNALKDKEANKKLDKETYDQEQKINSIVLSRLETQKQFIANTRVTSQFMKDAQSLLLRELDVQIATAKGAIEIAKNTFNRKQGDKYEPYKTPHDATNDELKAESDLTKALYDTWKLRSDNSAKSWKAIADDETNNLQARADAYLNYTNNLLNAAGLEAAKEQSVIQLKLDKIGEIEGKAVGARTQQEKKLLLEKATLEQQLVLATEKYEGQRSDIIAESAKFQLQLIKQYGTEAQRALTEATKNLKSLGDFFGGAAGLKQSRPEFEKQWKERTSITDAYFAAGTAAEQGFAEIESGINQKRLDAIDKEIAKIQERAQAEIDAVQYSAAYATLSEQDKNDKILAIKAAAAEEEKRLEKEKIERQRRQAIFQKFLTVTEIIAESSYAAIKALTDPTVPNYYLRLANAISAGVFGAAKAAAAAAAPIPQYAKGGRHKGGLAEVGDAYKTEVAVTDDGQVLLTPNTPTVVDLPKSTIYPSIEDYVAQMQYRSMKNLGAMLRPVREDQMSTKEMERLLKRVVSATEAVANKEPIIINNGFDTYYNALVKR